MYIFKVCLLLFANLRTDEFHNFTWNMQTSDFYSNIDLLIPARTPSPDIQYPYPLYKHDEDLKRAAMKTNQVRYRAVFPRLVHQPTIKLQKLAKT